MFKKIAFIGMIILITIYLLGIIMTHTTSPLDMAKIIELKTIGIKPHIPFYASTRTTVGSFQPELNYPQYPPISLQQAENAPYRVNNPFNTEFRILIVGDNYQIRERWVYRRKPQYILLDKQQLIGLAALENGEHFFIFDDDLQLQSITLKEAVSLPNYIKIVKNMGKIISIEKKPLLSITKWEYEYWPNNNNRHYLRSFSYTINKKQVLRSLFIEYDKNGNPLSVLTKNQDDKLISLEEYYQEDSDYVSETTWFDEQGVKRNIVYTPKVGETKNVHFDNEGNITAITYDNIESDHLPDFVEEQRYQNLAVDTSKQYKAEDSQQPEK